MTAYYNENNPYCVEWLRNLILCGEIADGEVDDRSIADVHPNDLRGFDQCHFFAGLGGWSRALRIAGWPDERPVWTGSCPCQPFSNAGKQQGFADVRHLWPEWFRLIKVERPASIFGEQVARGASDWLGLVYRDLASVDYAMGCLPIEAACIGAPHRRDRFWFVANAACRGWRQTGRDAASNRETNCEWSADWSRDASTDVAHTDRSRRPARNGHLSSAGHRGSVATGRDAGNTDSARLEIWEGERSDARAQQQTIEQANWWATEPDVGRVAHGIPARVDKLRALGNAIVPQVAATFICAANEALAEICG